MSDAGKAVFLSYASQDAEAARRLAESLRSAGVEVWFDQNELVGGDAWDQKIRKQIRECALLIPIISANTQSRTEGYFRLEWRLADQRTHLMAKGRPFLLPVVVDDTRDNEAHVPDSFLEVQWTRLPGGETPPKFTERVRKLMGGAEAEAGRPRSAEPRLGNTPPSPRRWLAPMIAGIAAALVALVISHPWDRAPRPSELSPAVAPPSEVRQLVAKAWVQLNKPQLFRAELEVAEEFAKHATELDSSDAEAWALASQVDSWFVLHGVDTTAQRREAARNKAAKALQLAPTNYEARLAQACYFVRGGGDLVASSSTGAAESLLQSLLKERPGEPRALFALATLQNNAGQATEARSTYERLAAIPEFAVIAWNEIGWADLVGGRYADAEIAVGKSIALQPYWGNLTLQALLAMWWRGDLDLAKSIYDRIPADVRLEDHGVANDCQLLFLRREPDALLRLLDGVPRDWLHSNAYDGPKALWAALAQEQLGRPDRARLQWQTALTQIERRLAEHPDADGLLRLKAYALAALGQGAAADHTLQLARDSTPGATNQSLLRVVATRLRSGHPDAALDLLEHAPQLTAAACRIAPQLDELRSQPRFQALLARLDADPRASPKAAQASGSPAVDQKSVAVLAFANLSDDKGNEYFSDGISEELLNVLAKVQGLKVTARTSSFHFKGKDTPISEIARQLGVAYVLEGSVRKAGDKVRITAQLIKAADGFHVWSDTFTRDLKDIFAVQDEIAGLIAKNLQLKMGLAAATTTRSIDPVAYQEYLAGRAAAEVGTEEKAKSALVHFQRALGAEPTFTAAWVQLALTYVHLGRWGGVPSETGWSEAIRAAEKAQALEPDSPDVLLAVGWVRRSAEWNWLGAEQAYRRALQLRPNHAETLVALGVLLANLGRNEEAIALAQRAYALDPLNAETQADLLNIYFVNERFSEAVQAGRRAVQLAPSSAHTHGWLAIALAYMHQYAEAEAEATMEPEAINRLLAQGIVLVKQNRFDEARAKVREMEARAESLQGAENVHISIAYLYSELGDTSKAVDSFIQTIADRDPSIAWARTRFFHNLDRDPRWKGVLNKIGLADDQVK